MVKLGETIGWGKNHIWLSNNIINCTSAKVYIYLNKLKLILIENPRKDGHDLESI
jgi:hypothetical protein